MRYTNPRLLYFTLLLKLTTDRHETLRSLFATAELPVIKPRSQKCGLYAMMLSLCLLFICRLFFLIQFGVRRAAAYRIISDTLDY